MGDFFFVCPNFKVFQMSGFSFCSFLRENIRFNALCPGPIRTDLLMKFLDTEEKRNKRLVHVPMGRFAEVTFVVFKFRERIF